VTKKTPPNPPALLFSRPLAFWFWCCFYCLDSAHSTVSAPPPPAKAQTFVDAYYQALTDGKPVAALYTSGAPAYVAISRPAELNINGARVARPEDYERMLADQRRVPFGFERVRYAVDNWDVHVVNPEFNIGCPPALLQQLQQLQQQQNGNGGGGGSSKASAGDRFMLSVMVSGTVLFGSGGADKDGAALRKTFYETFVLVPNWDVLAKRPPPARAPRYLILSQNYRTI